MNKKKHSFLAILMPLFATVLFSQAPDFQIYGPHNEYEKTFIVNVYYNYIIAPPCNSLDNIDAGTYALCRIS